VTRSARASSSAALVQILLGPMLFVLALGAGTTWALGIDHDNEVAMQHHRAGATVSAIGPPTQRELPRSEDERQASRPDSAQDAVAFSYYNPVVEAEVTVELLPGGLNEAGLTAGEFPEPLVVGQNLDIGYRPDNPYRIARWGRPVRPNLTIPAIAVTLLAAAAVAGYSLRTHRRLATLADRHTSHAADHAENPEYPTNDHAKTPITHDGEADNLDGGTGNFDRRPDPTRQRFRMLGALRRSRWSSGLILDLFPLDATAGDPPTCSVPLADITIGGETGRCFPVDVAGLPRPGGLLVPAAGGRILWPRGRALLTTSAPRPDIVTDGVVHAAGFDTFRPTVGSQTSIMRESTVLAWRGPLAAVAGLVLLWSIATVWLNWSEEKAAFADARPVTVEVANRVTDAFALPVDIVAGADRAAGPADGPGPLAAPVVTVNDFRVGQLYPALLAGNRVRLILHPYDPVTPLVFMAVVTALPVLAFLRRTNALRLARADQRAFR